MSCMNFPPAPASGDLYPMTPVSGMPQYRWDGEKWMPTVGLAGTGSVRYDTAQTLTDPQKAQARTNIAAADAAYVDSVASNKVSKAGDTMTGILKVQQTPAYGRVELSSGNETLPGYIAFFTPEGTRRGYIGWGGGSAIQLNGENSWGWQINGVLTTSTDIRASGNIWSAATYYFRGNGGMYLSHDGSNFVLAGGGFYCGYLNASSINSGGGITAAGEITANGSSIRVNGSGGNTHIWWDGDGVNRAILYWERATNHMQFVTPGGSHQFLGNGRFQCYQGYVTKPGMSGAHQSNCFNISHTTGQQLWIDLTNMGSFYFVSDYRTKKDIAPLPSMWNAVKRLKPISYTNKDFTPPVQETLQKSYGGGAFLPGDDIPRMGFLAHELQEELGESAANNPKDAPDAIQSPNPLVLIAALTKALQEAMARIETLEAR